MTKAVKNLATNIKRLREKRDWTQDDLAEKVGLSRSAIANIEIGKSSPRQETLKRLAAALGVAESSLYFDPSAMPSTADFQNLESAVRVGKELVDMSGGQSIEDLAVITALGVIMNSLGFVCTDLRRKRRENVGEG